MAANAATDQDLCVQSQSVDTATYQQVKGSTGSSMQDRFALLEQYSHHMKEGPSALYDAPEAPTALARGKSKKKNPKLQHKMMSHKKKAQQILP
jgi:predicted 3-demethylubiquinone-9 3-methyltransferase (glyoxalase superfamily)